MQRTRREPTRLLICLLAVHALAIALACGGPNASEREEDESRSIFGSSDPLDGLFGGPKLGPAPDHHSDTQTADKPADKPTSDTTPVQDKPAIQRASFFDLPAGWQIERHSPESQMYKLVHPNLPGASLVLSTQAIEGEGDVQEQLRAIHNNLVNKLPSSFKRIELREWLDEDDAHILTKLKGKRAEDQPELTITGHSIARAGRAYLILGAASPDQGAALQSALDSIIPTIHSPSAASAPTASKL
jgi:hypothetical protein